MRAFWNWFTIPESGAKKRKGKEVRGDWQRSGAELDVIACDWTNKRLWIGSARRNPNRHQVGSLEADIGNSSRRWSPMNRPRHPKKKTTGLKQVC